MRAFEGVGIMKERTLQICAAIGLAILLTLPLRTGAWCQATTPAAKKAHPAAKKVHPVAKKVRPAAKKIRPATRRVTPVGDQVGPIGILMTPSDELVTPTARQATPAKLAAPAVQKTAVLEPSTPLSEANSRGYALLADHQPLEALKEFNKALEIEKHNCRAMVGVALSHGAQGQWILAYNELETATLWNSHNSFAILNYLDCAVRVDRLNKALPVVKRLLGSNDTSTAETCQQVAEFLVEKDHWSAQWFAQRANALDPKAYPNASISAKPLKITVSKLAEPQTGGQNNTSTPNQGNANSNSYNDQYNGYDPSYQYPGADQYGGYGQYYGNPLGGYGQGYGYPMGGYGQSFGSPYGNMQSMPYDGSYLPYQSYPLGNGLNYVPPYNGPLNSYGRRW
jgi:hypothetical protein